jgi:hypothetical protein
MGRSKSEDVNQSARQVADASDDESPPPRRPATRGAPEQGLVKDKRGQTQPADKRRAQSDR